MLVNEPAEEVKCENLEKVIIDTDPEKFFQVVSELPLREKEELIGFQRKNVDMFAWDAYEAPGIDLSFICHHLNINPSVIPKKQPPRHPSKEHANAEWLSKTRQKSMPKLKKVGAIQEVFYPEWLANTVVVKKYSGKWRICIDFIDLNRACPKDPFPMPQIDQLMDATVGHPRISFLDAF